jgi:UDP-glucose 4-epimerase
LADTAPTIYGDGEQSRDFTFVDNVVEGNVRAMEADERAAGGVYNIACGTRVSLNELLQTLRELTGSDVQAEHAPARTGDVRHSLADVSRAQIDLGYRAQVGLREGLRRTLDDVKGSAESMEDTLC